MGGTLPKKLINIPMDVDPRSRYTRGGKDSCEHHYVNTLDSNGLREWTCANCDRICGFYKWEGGRFQ